MLRSGRWSPDEPGAPDATQLRPGSPRCALRPVTVLVTGSLRISGPRASSSAAAPGESRAERPHTRRPPRVPRPQRQSPCRAGTDGGTYPRRAHRGALGVWPATPRLPLTPGRLAARSPACDAPRDSRPAHPGTSVIKADGTSLQLRWLCQTNAQTHDREKRQVSARTRGARGPRPAGGTGTAPRTSAAWRFLRKPGAGPPKGGGQGPGQTLGHPCAQNALRKNRRGGAPPATADAPWSTGRSATRPWAGGHGDVCRSVARPRGRRDAGTKPDAERGTASGSM